jgi:hypothetical protein
MRDLDLGITPKHVLLQWHAYPGTEKFGQKISSLPGPLDHRGGQI